MLTSNFYTYVHTHDSFIAQAHTYTKGQLCVRSVLQSQERGRVMGVRKVEENLRGLRQRRYTFVTLHYSGRN